MIFFFFFLQRRVTGFVQTWKWICLEPSVQSKSSSSRPDSLQMMTMSCSAQSSHPWIYIDLENQNFKNSVLDLVGVFYSYECECLGFFPCCWLSKLHKDSFHLIKYLVFVIWNSCDYSNNYTNQIVC